MWCLVCGWWLSDANSQALLPTIAVQDLDHFRINRNLKSYLDVMSCTFTILIRLNVRSAESLDAEYYAEAKQYSDIIIYNFQDHYQNLTLKTGLILQWTVRRCSPRMLFKTDDDIFINPWMMNRLLQEYSGTDLVGKVLSCNVLRDRYHKWFLLRWLYPSDSVSEYLSGAGYLINGLQLLLSDLVVDS
ncbi:unnamed protein product, partial [Brenthis ino]